MNTPLINGVNHSWANVKFTLFGVPVVGITKISYKKSQKKERLKKKMLIFSLV